MPKTRKQKNNALFVGIALIIFIAVFIAVLVFLLFVYNNIQKVQSDVYNVKEAVSVQQKNSFDNLQDKLQNLIEDKKQSATLPYNYENYNLGFRLSLPYNSDLQSSLVEDGNVILFGPMTDFSGHMMPQFSLRVFPDFTFEDYQGLIHFSEEPCSEGEECIFQNKKVQDNRESLLSEMFTPISFGKISGYEYVLNDQCYIPTIILIDSNNLYEFQEHCVSNINDVSKVRAIVETFSLLD